MYYQPKVAIGHYICSCDDNMKQFLERYSAVICHDNHLSHGARVAFITRQVWHALGVRLAPILMSLLPPRPKNQTLWNLARIQSSI